MILEGKVVVVTGAASGLGRASCMALVEAGASVMALDRDKARLDELLASAPGGRVRAQVTDVADEGSVRSAIDATVEAFGALHVAVNCAGVADAAKTISKGAAFPFETWRKVIDINLTGTFNVLRFAALAMSGNEPDESGECGVIINTASGAAWQGQVGQAAYSASKAGVIGLTLPAARDLAEHAIRVVAIAPGLFETSMVASMPDTVSRSIIDRMILFPERMGQPQEFAMLVRQIVENPYLNATTISIDAGARMTPR